jgi:glycosyltransferase involved in cell wall biosynthesis
MAKISVVVASKVGPPFIDQCLESLKNEIAACDGEAIVVVGGTRPDASRIAVDFPWARVIRASDQGQVPALRRRGVEEATADLVAVIEEHCSAAEGWLRHALGALASGEYGAVGGAISDYHYERLRDWVVYFCEYNSSLPPAPKGETDHLNDANIAYRRSLLLDHAHLLDDGYWPMTLHPTLREKGIKFLSVPDMVVYHRGPFDFGYYLRQRFWFSRAFAGVRARARSPVWRVAYLVGAPLIPVMLLGRMAQRVFEKRCRVWQFILTLPLTVPALVVLAAGEWVGCLLGPGDALSKVE